MEDKKLFNEVENLFCELNAAKGLISNGSVVSNHFY